MCKRIGGVLTGRNDPVMSRPDNEKREAASSALQMIAAVHRTEPGQRPEKPP
jgi:hypothetical protein